MPRRFLQKLIPDTTRLRQHPAFASLGDGLKDPRAWHLNRRSVSGAVAIGLFIGWLPIPMQMLIAGFLAVVMHVNLPVAVILVWISNPLTLPPILYAGFQVGSRLTGENATAAPGGTESSIQGMLVGMSDLWFPMFAGCMFLGAVSGVLGFFLTRVLWRVALMRRWHVRKLNRHQLPALKERPRST